MLQLDQKCMLRPDPHSQASPIFCSPIFCFYVLYWMQTEEQNEGGREATTTLWLHLQKKFLSFVLFHSVLLLMVNFRLCFYQASFCYL